MMDNKRLKTFVGGWFLGYPIDCEKSEEDEALRIILTMIDSQPTEEEAIGLWDSLKFSTCSSSTNRKDYHCHKCGASFDWKAEGGGWNGKHGTECIMSILSKILGIEAG